MSGAAIPARGEPYTAATLHRKTRELHRPSIEWLNLGWLCVIAAVALSVLGIVVIYSIIP